jgi:hypothetical protein
MLARGIEFLRTGLLHTVGLIRPSYMAGTQSRSWMTYEKPSPPA